MKSALNTLSNLSKSRLRFFSSSSPSPQTPPTVEQTKSLTSRFRALALASAAGFAFGALMELAYYKSGYYEKLQKPVKIEIEENLNE